MRSMLVLLACLAALSAGACGKKGAGGEAAAVEAASPLASAYSLEGGKEVDVDALLALFSDGEPPTYQSAIFDEKLGATVVTGLRFSGRQKVSDDAGNEISIESRPVLVERAELYGVDIDAINRVKAGAAAIDAPFEKIFEKVRLFGVKPEPTEGEGETTIGAIEFDQLRLRHGGLPDEKEDSAAKFFNAFELAGLYFKDIVAASPDDDRGAFSFKAPDLRIVELGGGKLSALIVKHLEYTVTRAAGASLEESMGPAAGALLSGPLSAFIAPSDQRGVVKSVEWRGIDLSGLMGYGLKNEKPPLTATNLISLGTLKALGAETFIGGKSAAAVAETTFSATEFTGVVPSKIRSANKGARYDFTAYVPESEADTIAILKKHGLDDVRGSGTLDWDWDSAKGGAGLKTMFETKGLADFELTLDFTGMEIAKIAALKEAGEKDAVTKVGAFKGFYLKFADEKLLDAVFDISALEMGGTGADLRQSAPAMVRLAGAAPAASNPRIGRIVDAVADFIAAGGTIEFTAKPETPAPLQAIAAASNLAPETVPDLINLEVKHTAP